VARNVKIKRFLYLNFRYFYSFEFWVRRHFTPAGQLVLGAAGLSAALGVDTTMTVIYQFFTLLVSVLFVSLVVSVFYKLPFGAERKLPRFGTAHTQVTYSVVIYNFASKEQKGLELIEDFADPRPSFEEFLNNPEPYEKERNIFDRYVKFHRWLWLVAQKRGAFIADHSLPPLPPMTHEEVKIEFTPLRRGRLFFSGITLARRDPFGLFRSFATFPLHQSLLILPKRYALPQIRLSGRRKYQHGGVTLASSVGDSEEFIALRDYHPGDPLRYIHWRSTAKKGFPVVKEHQEEFFVRHALLLDTFLNKGNSYVFEEAVSVAASFISSVQSDETLLDLMFIGTEVFCFTSGRGVGHTDRALEILAEVIPCHNRHFSDLHNTVMNRISSLSSCICILLSWDDERKKFISQLKTFGLPVLVMVITDDKSADDYEPGPLMNSPGNFHILEAGSIEEGLAKL
jgi:hypothetical protein